MTNPNRRRTFIRTLIGGLVVATLPLGCAEEAPPPPPPAPVQKVQAPPPPPAAKSVEQLMAELNIDQRISLPDLRAPATTEARIAVLEFFDSMCRGDTKSLGPMLSAVDKMAMDELVESGVWAQTTQSIRRIEIQTGQSPVFGEPAALAVIEVARPDRTVYEPQLWYYQPSDGRYSWSAVATPPGIMEKLSGEDWIEAWHKLLEQDLALADKPDEEINEKQADLDEGGEGSGERPASPEGPGQPSTPQTPRTPYQPPRP